MCPKCVCLGKSLMVNFLSSSAKKKLHIKYIHACQHFFSMYELNFGKVMTSLFRVQTFGLWNMVQWMANWIPMFFSKFSIIIGNELWLYRALVQCFSSWRYYWSFMHDFKSKDKVWVKTNRLPKPKGNLKKTPCT